MAENDTRMTHEEFFQKAIKNLRNLEKSKGIHSVFSGFNQAFRKYYDEDPIPVTRRLADAGIIEIQPRRGGVMIYLPGEGPTQDRGGDALDKILKS
jgi:hypothetical protein